MATMNGRARWSRTAVTDAGIDMLADYAAGRILSITGAFGSAGTAGTSLEGLEELPDERSYPLTIESVTKTKDSITVCIQVTSIGNPKPYKLETVGIYAVTRDPGDEGEGTGRDRLLMVIEDDGDGQGNRGITIPAESDQIYTFKLYAVLAVTNRERLEISVSSAGIATVGAVELALRTHDQDGEAHGGVMARVRAAEIAINGSETLTGDGVPGAETAGEVGRHYVDTATGTEYVCTGNTEEGSVWEPAPQGTPTIQTVKAELSKQLADHDARLALIELMYNTDVSGNPYTVTFENLTGLVCTGVWNAALGRLEF